MAGVNWLDRESALEAYNAEHRHYQHLANGLRRELPKLLEQRSIDTQEPSIRVKEFDSFYRKLIEKGYTGPFDRTEDLCGARIICYYQSDMEKIGEMIREEFNVLREEKKAFLTEPDRFGYRSDHYVVTLNQDWLRAPTLRGLEGRKAEIQVRGPNARLGGDRAQARLQAGGRGPSGD